MKKSSTIAALLCAVCVTFAGVGTALAQATPDRSILPPPAPAFKGRIGETYKDSTPDFSPALPLAALEGAPECPVRRVARH